MQGDKDKGTDNIYIHIFVLCVPFNSFKPYKIWFWMKQHIKQLEMS